MKKKAAPRKKPVRAARPRKARAAASVSKEAPLSPAERALRETGLSWPEVTEHFPWGHRTLKVAGKAFIFVGGDATTWRVSLKLPNTGMMALALPFAAPTGYGMGKSGWVTASFAPDEDPPTPLLLDWLRESYRAVAPARLKNALDGEAVAARSRSHEARVRAAKGAPAPLEEPGKTPRPRKRRATVAAANSDAKRKRSRAPIAGPRNSG